MSRYDYCESLERRIEKLERELYRKDELFGLGSKNRGVTISNGKNLMKMLKSSIQPDLRKYLSYEAGVNDFNISFKANDGVITFWFRDSKDNDGMTNVRCASRNRNFEDKTFDITDKADIEDICDWMEERITRAYDEYRSQNERLKRYRR